MKQKPYRFFLYLLVEGVNIIILILPYKISVFLGGLCGVLAYATLVKYKNITIDNLRSVFAHEKSEREIRQIAKDVFRNIGITATECLSLRKLTKKKILKLVKEKNFSTIKRVLSEGKGIIVITSHLGNWEISSVYGVATGYDVTVIARRIYYPYYNKFLVRLRSSKSVKTLYRDDKRVIRKSLEVLKSGGILGIAPDQDVDSVDGVFVDFFGKKAYTPTGPVNLAMLSGAPMVPAFTVRKNGRLHLFVEEPIYVEKGSNKKESIIKYTQKWSDVVEKYIRMYPSQWMWMHRRWKTQQSKLGKEGS